MTLSDCWCWQDESRRTGAAVARKDSEVNLKPDSRQASRPVSRQSSGLPSRQSSILFIDVPFDDEAGDGQDDGLAQENKHSATDTDFEAAGRSQPLELQKRAAPPALAGEGVSQRHSSKSKPLRSSHRNNAQFWTNEESAALQTQLHALRSSSCRLWNIVWYGILCRLVPEADSNAVVVFVRTQALTSFLQGNFVAFCCKSLSKTDCPVLQFTQ